MADDTPPLPAGAPPGEAPPAPEATNAVAAGQPTPAVVGAAAPTGAIKAQPMPSVAPIPLTAPATKPTSTTSSAPKPPEHKDGFRELLETVVFVVVLVLMLKTFLAEAFVIPTGSMATTLLGYHHKLTCEQCGRPYLVNASAEAEPQDGGLADPVIQAKCPNCKFPKNRGVPR